MPGMLWRMLLLMTKNGNSNATYEPFFRKSIIIIVHYAIDCVTSINLTIDCLNMKKYLLLTLSCFICALVPAQAQNIPVILEVEDGNVGADFASDNDGEVTYLTISTNGTAGTPENEDRVITFEVTFPAAQQYDLYLRCRVGPNGADDDSFFYGSDFGTLSLSSDNAWVRANNLNMLGYTGSGQIVDGGGIAGTGTWKWINLSEYTGDEPPVIFEVASGALTQTFQIGAREDGLDFDKIAFARADYFYTVSNLDNGEAGSPENGGAGYPGPPLADGHPKFLGSAYSQSQKQNFANYWNQVTPENGGKWGSVEATRDVMVWTEMDSAYAMAKDNGYPFKLHVLIWGNQQPAWIENLPPSEQLEEIEEWFQAIADRYPDIDFIEVVNEPLHDPPNSSGDGGGNYIEALGGNGSTGWDWILEAFRMARETFPGVELMLNDYSIINSVSSTNQYLEIIELLQNENLIDQIGFQGHAFSTANASVNTIMNNLDALAATGLPLYVTELDIDGPTDQVQLDEFQRIFPVFWEYPAVQGITLWGYRPGMWRTEQGAFLIEEDGFTERPALEWLRNYLQGTSSIQQPNLSDQIAIFPNPLGGNVLNIESEDLIHQAQLLDLSGRPIWSGAPVSNQITFQNALPGGLYLLQLYGEQNIYVKKLVVR